MIIFLGVYVIRLEKKLNTMMVETNQSIDTVKQELSSDISSVTDAMYAEFNNQQSQLDSQKAEIENTKQVIHISNKALVRVNKELGNKEKEIEELREELKKY
jgi:septal ring factor EnvC (AmiA/AmiB activator)